MAFFIARQDVWTRTLFDKLCLGQSLDAQRSWALRRSEKIPLGFLNQSRPVRQITRLNVCFYRRFFVSKENNYLVVPFVVPIGQRLDSNITTNILIHHNLILMY